MIINIQKNPTPLITRFAPSPTGFLHIGHIVSMAFVYGIARATNAKLLLRIEDHDRGRCRPEYEQAIFDDLHWLGFTFDEKPNTNQTSTLRQSDRTLRYQEICNDLLANKLAYRCTCSRSQIQKKMQASQVNEHGTPDELFYDGTCRKRDISSDAGACGIRLMTPDKTFTFCDGKVGLQAQNPAHQCGDILIKDRNGNFTYQFAVAIDDFDQNVNLIVRGEDLLTATGRQIFIGETVGRSAPAQFVHHPLITDETGKKLSKRFFSEAVGKKRSDGLAAEALLGQSLYQVGILDRNRPIHADELSAIFKIREINGHC